MGIIESKFTRNTNNNKNKMGTKLINSIKDGVRIFPSMIIMIPFIPLIALMMWILGKGFEYNSKIPEDLQDQLPKDKGT